ncbi:MAG: HlyC/CorC family transporter [Rhodocyclaceae bacterium]|nr:HlyC/CorC family transporter [Rhodocyclaceae bacterium]
MTDTPFSVKLVALGILLVLSGTFSMAETAMMAANRYRLRSQSASGHKGAALALELLGKTDRLLGVILLFNNLINAAAAMLVSLITIELFGEEEWALGLATVLVTFLILVFSEITPKVIGANHADRLAIYASYVLAFLLKVTGFIVSFVNLFVFGLLRLIRLSPDGGQERHRLAPEELRALVIESGQYIPQKHRSILVNLFELEDITVEDVMTPRSSIEGIDLADPLDAIKHQIATSYHTRLPVFSEEMDDIVGILHLRRLLGRAMDADFDLDDIRAVLQEPYFIPSNTPVFSQLRFFQENRQRLGLVVDEYGELLGLVTLEDIIEELIGKFTTSTPDSGDRVAWGEDGTVLVDGSQGVRDLNRKLGLNLPVDGPKTINGLLIEYLQEIPETGLSVKFGDIPIEVVQTQDRMVRTVRIFQPQVSGNEN